MAKKTAKANGVENPKTIHNVTACLALKAMAYLYFPILRDG